MINTIAIEIPKKIVTKFLFNCVPFALESPVDWRILSRYRLQVNFLATKNQRGVVPLIDRFRAQINADLSLRITLFRPTSMEFLCSLVCPVWLSYTGFTVEAPREIHRNNTWILTYAL